jgi:methylthioribulose-1-phosphate dehydratase
MLEPYRKATEEIIAAGQRLDARGLAPATSGNYSVRLNDGRIAITVSGRHKGRMVAEDIMLIDSAGKPLEDKKPSAETLLHVVLYKAYPQANAVLHTHSVAGVALTRFLPRSDKIVLEGYEMLKAFPGITTHETKISIPVFDNTQDMDFLAEQVKARLEPGMPAYLIKDHGIYTWGKDMEEAERVSEALEHILLCEIEMLKLQGKKHA